MRSGAEHLGWGRVCFAVWLVFLPGYVEYFSDHFFLFSQGHLIANVLKAQTDFFPLILTPQSFPLRPFHGNVSQTRVPQAPTSDS